MIDVDDTKLKTLEEKVKNYPNLETARFGVIAAYPHFTDASKAVFFESPKDATDWAEVMTRQKNMSHFVISVLSQVVIEKTTTVEKRKI